MKDARHVSPAAAGGQVDPRPPLPPILAMPANSEWRLITEDWGHARLQATTWSAGPLAIVWIIGIGLLFAGEPVGALVFAVLGLPFVVLLRWVRRLPQRAAESINAAMAAGRYEPVRVVHCLYFENLYGIRRYWVSLERADGTIVDVRVPGVTKAKATSMVIDIQLWLVIGEGGRFGAVVDPLYPTRTRYLRGPVPLPLSKVPRRGGIRRRINDLSTAPV